MRDQNDKRQYFRQYYRERVKSSPERLADKTRRSREHYARAMSTPEGREKWLAAARNWKVRERSKDPKAWDDRVYVYFLKRRYGLSADQYAALRTTQSESCAICHGRDQNRRLAVDHCHATGRVRGLLCNRCNQGLSRFRDDPELLLAAIAYLKTEADWRHYTAPSPTNKEHS